MGFQKTHKMSIMAQFPRPGVVVAQDQIETSSYMEGRNAKGCTFERIPVRSHGDQQIKSPLHNL